MDANNGIVTIKAPSGTSAAAVPTCDNEYLRKFCAILISYSAIDMAMAKPAVAKFEVLTAAISVQLVPS